MSNNNVLTSQLIRSHVLQFVKGRERAYNIVIAKGNQVPEYDRKVKAIKALYVQLQASEHWTLHAQLLWIHAMRHLITLLLPMQDHPQQAQRTCRTNMLHLLNYCDELLLEKYQTPLFV